MAFKKGMVMELVERPLRRNRSFKLGRVSIKMRRRTRLRRNRPTKTRSQSGKLTCRFWNIELRVEIVPD
jgi:hypothetical protein